MRFEKDDYFFTAIARHRLFAAKIEQYQDYEDRRGKVVFPVPREHARLLSFGRRLVDLVGNQSELLVIPTDWGIWRSSENWHLYELICQASGGGQSHLKERPTHCFAGNEHDLALDFIYLFLLFSWDFFVFGGRDEDLLFVSHDGFALYYSPTRTVELEAMLEDIENGSMPQ